MTEKPNEKLEVVENNIFIEQNSPEPKVKVLIPMYEPLEVTKCEKCNRIVEG
jgi:hypothetical protein